MNTRCLLGTPFKQGLRRCSRKNRYICRNQKRTKRLAPSFTSATMNAHKPRKEVHQKEHMRYNLQVAKAIQPAHLMWLELGQRGSRHKQVEEVSQDQSLIYSLLLAPVVIHLMNEQNLNHGSYRIVPLQKSIGRLCLIRLSPEIEIARMRTSAVIVVKSIAPRSPTYATSPDHFTFLILICPV